MKDFSSDMDSLRVFLRQSKVWIMGHSAGGYQALYYGIHNNLVLVSICNPVGTALRALAGFDKIKERMNLLE